MTTPVMLGYKISFNKVWPDPERLQPLLDLPPPTNLKEPKRASGRSHTILSGYLIFLPRRAPFCVQRVFPSKEVLYLQLGCYPPRRSIFCWNRRFR